MNRMGYLLIFVFLLTGPVISKSRRLQTNHVDMQEAPMWLTNSRVERVTHGVQDFLEWYTRKFKVYWYQDSAQFQAKHKLSSRVQAFFLRSDGSVHLGPKVNQDNFDAIFGHELVHVILHQKYKLAVPKWLEEGLANYIAGKGKVNYAKLAKTPIGDVTRYDHPYTSGQSSTKHYQVSRALVEMIVARCSLTDLLQLSVGKKMETYLSTYCEIKDINLAFKKWLKSKTKTKRSTGSRGYPAVSYW